MQIEETNEFEGDILNDPVQEVVIPERNLEIEEVDCASNR